VSHLKDAIYKAPNPPLLTPDEQQVVQAYRLAAQKDFADLLIKIQNGRLAFLELTEKLKPIVAKPEG
jgi:hypothetical protein